MSGPEHPPQTRLAPLFLAWLGLVILTLLSAGLGDWLRGFPRLTQLVAAVIWLKAWLVAYYFLEVSASHRLIRRLVWTFIAFAPLALALTDYFGAEFADWASL